jgi:DNA repair photolyase
MYGYKEIEKMSLAAIKKLNDKGIKCTILSKGILPAQLAEYSPDNEYGITLVSLKEEYREKMEPGAASYQERLAALRVLHDRGCKNMGEH